MAAASGPAGTGVDVLLTVREVAGHLRVSTATVYALCKRSLIDHRRVSNAIRIPTSSVASYCGRARWLMELRAGWLVSIGAVSGRRATA